MSIRAYFQELEEEFKVVGKVIETDVIKIFSSLFGPQALSQLEAAAETILKSDFGQAILPDALELVAEVKSGKRGAVSAVAVLASDIATEGGKVGKSIEITLATMVASMAVAKAQGILGAPAPAPSPAPPTT